MSSEFKANKNGCLQKLNQHFQFLFEEALIQEMCSVGIIKNYPDDTILMEIGQVLTHMPIVLSGSLKIMKEDKEGNELLLYYLELGDTCAVTLSCCTKPSKSGIKAVTESNSEIIFIPVEKMEEWMVKYKSWRGFVLDSYNVRLNEMLDAIDNLAFNNMEDRLIKYLRDKVYVTKDSKLHITHFQIANDLHSSRVVVSRIMKKLENQGIIIQHRNYVEVKEFMN
jgi:CRP/FNR family transcriptional regulator, anaerobic regulatory protein